MFMLLQLSPSAYACFLKRIRLKAMPPLLPLDKGATSGFCYDFSPMPYYSALREEYRLASLAGEGDSLTRALRLMQWLCAHTYYSGAARLSGKKFKDLPDTQAILRFAVDKPFLYALNCRDKAIVLSDLLLSVGIFAMPLWLVRGGNCHCITHVFLPEHGVWSVLDPSFNAYFMAEKPYPLDIIALRESSMSGNIPAPARYSLNGGSDCLSVYTGIFIAGCLDDILFWQGNTHRRLPDTRKPQDSRFISPRGGNTSVEDLLRAPPH